MPGISRWLWGGLFIVTPLTLNPISYWNSEPDHAAVAFFVAGLIFGLALFRGHLNKRRLVGPEYLALLFLGIYVVATANSIMPAWSFWGTPEWRNGCLMLAIGIALFFCCPPPVIFAKTPVIDHPNHSCRQRNCLYTGNFGLSSAIPEG